MKTLKKANLLEIILSRDTPTRKLSNLSGFITSLAKLKKRLQTLKLSRRKQGEDRINDDDVKKAIEEELAGSGRFVGYRSMWATLKKKGIFVQ